MECHILKLGKQLQRENVTMGSTIFTLLLPFPKIRVMPYDKEHKNADI